MADLNLEHLITRFVNYQKINIKKQTPSQSVQTFYTNSSQSSDLSGSYPSSLQETGKIDQSVYVKDLMKLPKNLNELVYIMQRNISAAQFNQRIANHIIKTPISQTQAQILAQLQGLSITEAQNLILNGNKSTDTEMQNLLKKLNISSALINLSEISTMIQANGKDAIAKLITTMANSAKLGITDLTQLKETAKLINASVAAASQNDSAQTLKLLMLLYLPWLPLQEGTGFDIDIETGENAQILDSILTITISTLNYEDITAVLVLENSNSVHVNIKCIKDFPKDELLIRIQSDEKHYSMHSNLSFETDDKRILKNIEKPQAKINMSNTNELNPFLLLMVHSIIRHVIEIDKNKGE